MLNVFVQNLMFSTKYMDWNRPFTLFPQNTHDLSSSLILLTGSLRDVDAILWSVAVAASKLILLQFNPNNIIHLKVCLHIF